MAADPSRHAQFPVLGLPINAITLPEAVEYLEESIRSKTPRLVCVCTANTLTLAQRDPELRRMVETCDLVTPDGYPLTFLGRRRAHRPVGRVRGTDTTLALCQRAAHMGYRSYFYGATPSTLEALASNLRNRFPGFMIVGTKAPPFRPLTDEEFRRDINEINDAKPDIVWVGIGCPKQEKWALRARPHLQAPLILPVGAAFDFLAGTTTEAPRWIRNIGLEFLWRFLQEPRRLWKRVIVEGTKFVRGVVWENITQSWKRDQARLDGPRHDA